MVFRYPFGFQDRVGRTPVCAEMAKPEDTVYTRIAGGNGGVLPQSQGEATYYALWLDPSYAVYLWETLLEIVTELGGGAIETAE